jgi:hypothetical protein
VVLNLFDLLFTRNFTQFYSTKSERDRNMRKEYETQMEYRKHLQAFIDRWRYNANRGMSQVILSAAGIEVFRLSCAGSDENQNFGEGRYLCHIIMPLQDEKTSYQIYNPPKMRRQSSLGVNCLV